MLYKTNRDVEVIGYCDLGVVKDIEDGHTPSEIIASHSIPELIRLMAKNRAETVILACTHYAYLYKDLSIAIDGSVPILEPSFLMMQKIAEQSYSKKASCFGSIGKDESNG